jgi:hypothetical protein
VGHRYAGNGCLAGSQAKKAAEPAKGEANVARFGACSPQRMGGRHHARTGKFGGPSALVSGAGLPKHCRAHSVVCGALINSVPTLLRANSSISRTWYAYFRLNRSGEWTSTDRSVPLTPSHELLDTRANEGSTAVSLILEHPFIGSAETLLRSERTQRLRLTRNCVLLPLS